MITIRKYSNKIEIRNDIIKALLYFDVINIKAMSRCTGHSRSTILSYIKECREDITNCYHKGFIKKKCGYE